MQSRVLPSRPNLDHLKHEAKALLKTLRESDPSAKLTDAQRQLAREYGFPTWARLRAQVLANRSTGDETVDAFLAAVQNQDRASALAIAEQHPAIVASSLHVAAVLGASADAAAIISRDKSAVRMKAGNPAAEPLLYLCFSPFHGESAARDDAMLATTHVLLGGGADPNALDGRYGVSALYGVTGMNNAPRVARALLEAGANPNDGESVFHAAERFHEEALALLWEFKVDLNFVGEWGNTALYFVLLWHDLAREEKAVKGVEWLLAHGADPNIPSGKEREDALQVAARRGQPTAVVRQLLAHGANPNSRRGDGATPWLLAKRGGHDEIAKLLEEAGAKPEPLSPADELLAACGRGDVNAARRLASPGLITSLAPSDRALLSEAAAAGRTPVVAACIAAGFDVNDVNHRGASALHEAAISGHSEVVRALLAAGARHDIEDPEHHATAMGWAIFGADFVQDPAGRYDETVRALLDAGATIRTNEHEPRHEGVRRVIGL